MILANPGSCAAPDGMDDDGDEWKPIKQNADYTLGVRTRVLDAETMAGQFRVLCDLCIKLDLVGLDVSYGWPATWMTEVWTAAGVGFYEVE
jgi:hypothetical protein